jgi:hypothetical protein
MRPHHDEKARSGHIGIPPRRLDDGGRVQAVAERDATFQVGAPAPGLWSELSESDPDALVTQSRDWVDSVCAVTGARDVSRVYDFGGGRRLLLPLVRRGSERSGLATESSMPSAWGFGGLLGGEPTVDEVRSVMSDLAARPAMSVRIRPNPLHDEVWRAACPPGTVTIERRAHVVDLDGGFDAAWQRFSSRARNHVRRAERSGLRIELDTAGRLVPAYYELFMQSVERWARRQNEPRVLARWRARRRDPVDKFEQVLRALGERGRLWMAFSDDTPVAAIIVLQDRNAHYTRGVMNPELAGPTRANYLLHRLAIEDACAAGCRKYHMGETGTSSSLAQFKEALGARPHTYAEYVIEGLPIVATDRMLRTAVKRVLRVKS